MTAIDAAAAPRAAEYLAGLPAGLDSYPDCTVRAELARDVFRRYPQIPTHAALSGEVQERLRAAVSEDWMPDVIGTLARILVRDVGCASDEEYHRWAFESAAEIFSRTAYRMLMYVLSPTLVVLGATKRWSTFRRGSTLRCTVDGTRATGELRFPPNLYSPLVLDGFGDAFRASLVAARARNTVIELVEATPVLARWDMRWG
jgi:hypothetical protein